MSKKDKQQQKTEDHAGEEFESATVEGLETLTRRDEFAKAAMQGLLVSRSAGHLSPSSRDCEDLAVDAYAVADAMVAEAEARDT